MESQKMFKWHPIYKYNQNELYSKKWTLNEFEIISSNIKKFSDDLSIRSSEIKPNNTNYLYEVNIYNEHKENNHVDSYWWVNIEDKDKWWPSDETMLLFNKYGWFIKSE